ncbi:5-oxoprolinase subunit PxpB [Dyella nitratireducens]|uniref:Allophanate hydrolase n=1 Tax=Dyella nitratireducens TaxID=1849580 RepID=A0ABQ1G8X3_9GAMM|nr:5-oxoprolinase subunit PxpB [Dyella nitratireducens]GGA39017.1 allophanate hydrolase [Dyella nitratireducens]GLQ40392.1 allophanate hydrolase [Dyella nitratireducens]
MTQAWPPMQIEPLAEDAWLLRLGGTIDIDVNARVHAAAARLRSGLADVECVPAYASLLLRFDPMRWLDNDGDFSGQRLRGAIDAALQQAGASETAPRELIIPVCYGGEAGEDLHDVAAHTQLSPEEIIARHTAPTYRVAMLGFAPGFPYLLGLDPALAMPRRSSPRTSVPAGSVAIGGQQTGIYPQALPGGWQLIGRTPLRLFDATAGAPSLLLPGDRVRFRAIDGHEYRRFAAAT